jgi:hypothetical protein
MCDSDIASERERESNARRLRESERVTRSSRVWSEPRRLRSRAEEGGGAYEKNVKLRYVELSCLHGIAQGLLRL